MTNYFDYGYDHFGNQTSETETNLLPKSPTTTTYNGASQTRRVTSPDGSWVEYVHDGLERMVSRQDSTGAVVLFFHQGMSDQTAVETDAGGGVKTRYLVDAFSMPRGKLDIGNSTGRSYYITDLRGNVTQMVQYTDHAIKAVFAYDPYGKDKAATGLTKTTGNWDSRLRFQMAPRDPKTGAYNIGARIMDPKINRFVGADLYVSAAANLDLQLDPLTGNRYLYAGANPAGLIDDGHGYCFTGHIDVSNNESRCIRPWEHVPPEVLSLAPGYSCLQFRRHGGKANAAFCAVDVAIVGGLARAEIRQSRSLIQGVREGRETRAASSAIQGLRLNRQLAAEEIAGGHAFQKHAAEFKELGITTREEFTRHVERILNYPTASKVLSNGRTAYWDARTGTVVIRNPRAPDGGTAFIPSNGKSYYEGLG